MATFGHEGGHAFNEDQRSAMRDAHVQQVKAAIAQLSQSDRGHGALRALKRFIDDGCYGLDGANQEAVVVLLGGFWSGISGTTAEAIEAAVTRPTPGESR